MWGNGSRQLPFERFVRKTNICALAARVRAETTCCAGSAAPPDFRLARQQISADQFISLTWLKIFA
jgi:hypothetical protein